MIKNLSRLLASSNSDGKRREHFCLNCLQGFHCNGSRNKHFEYCIDHEAVRIDIPPENSFIRFHSGQYQFKVPFIIYTDFEAILQSLEEETSSDPLSSYMRKINHHIPSVFCMYTNFTYKKAENLLSLYQGKDCMEVFYNHIKEQAKRL